jgi:hypothetical protein
LIIGGNFYKDLTICLQNIDDILRKCENNIHH